MSSKWRRPAARNLFPAAVLFIAFLAAAPLFLDAGLLNTRGGGDSPFLLQRLQQLTTALADGHFPVRWMPDANYGYGYPFYNYYAPLSIYVAAIFRFLGAGYVLAIKGAQLAGFLIAAWGMFALVRRWLGSPWAGLLAATAYTVAPFHMVNVYVRGDSLAEFWAMAFYPLLVLSADRLLAAANGNRENTKALRAGAAVLALVFAALILSHNISALIFTPFLLLYLVLEGWKPGHGRLRTEMLPGKTLLWLGVGLLLALALASWFWLPALAESSLAQLEPVTEGYFHYSNHFRDSDLLQQTFVFDYDPAGGRAFSMGLVQAAGILLGLIALLIHRRRSPETLSRRRLLFVIGGLLVATLMISSLSRWLWDNLPLLSFTQFPWRFLSIQAFFGALAFGGLALLPGRRAIVPMAMGLLLASALIGLPLDFLKVGDPDVTAERLAQYEWYSGNIGTTVSAEYLPESVQPRPQTSPWLNGGSRYAIQALEGETLVVEPGQMRTAAQQWRITAGAEGATVSLPTMAWPGWQAWVDGQTAAIEATGGSGLISVYVPPGEHLVALRLGRTPVRLAGELAALAAMAVWGFLAAGSIHFQRPGRRAWIFFGGLGLLLAVLWAWPEVRGRQDDLNWDFAQMAYLHHADQGIDFENGARLIGYRYGAEEVTAGETLLVTLTWAGGATGQARLELVTPAVNRSPRAPAFAQQTLAIQDGDVTYALLIPDNAPAGLVTPRLVVSGAQPLTPSGLTRGNLFLRPLLLEDRPEAAAVGLARLDARAMSAVMRNRRVLDVQLQWLTRQPLSENYNYSLRIVDGDGREVAQQDGQPGFGFLPSSGWPTGQWVDDWLGLTWREEDRQAAGPGPFDVVARLYDLSNGEVVMTRLLGQLAWQAGQLRFAPPEPVFALPEQARPLAVDFGPTESGAMIKLAGYDLRQEADRLQLTLYWSADKSVQEDLYHFVHLEDVNGAIVNQHDGMPRNNNYPTSQWVAGEIVSDKISIALDELPAGPYSLHAGLYHLQDGQAVRAPVASAGGLPAADDRLTLPETIAVR